MKKNLKLFLIACILPLAIYAQDPHWSMIQWNPLYLNPAFTGFAAKANRITGIYRDQWRSVPVSYSTSHFSYDRKVVESPGGFRFGLGVQFMYDRAADGALSSFRPTLNAAVGQYFNSHKQVIQLGLTGSYVMKQLDFNKLTFDSQFDGIDFDPSLPAGEQFSSDNDGYFELGAGFNFSSNLKASGTIDIGVSAFNLTSPSYSFVENSEAEVKPRIMAYTKANIRLGKSAWEFNPGVFYQNQNKAQETLVQALFAVRVTPPNQPKDVKLTFGPGYRVNDAVVGYVGMKWNDLLVAFAFDGNVSDFKTATSGRGAYEVTLNYEWEKKKKEKPLVEVDTLTEEEEEEEVKEEQDTAVIEPVTEEEIIQPEVAKVDSLEELNRELRLLEEELLDILPVQLFFDNDQPDPRTQKTTTTVSYDQAVRNYMAQQQAYVTKYGPQAAQFFTQRVQAGLDTLSETLPKMKRLLENGKTVTIEIKGYTSPLASSAYNESLSLRRIASVENYLRSWMNGALAQYLSSGNLVIKRSPFGETTAPANVSDSQKDVKNSIYSPDAAYERRVEIEKISVQ